MRFSRAFHYNLEEALLVMRAIKLGVDHKQLLESIFISNDVGRQKQSFALNVVEAKLISSTSLWIIIIGFERHDFFFLVKAV